MFQYNIFKEGCIDYWINIVDYRKRNIEKTDATQINIERYRDMINDRFPMIFI